MTLTATPAPARLSDALAAALLAAPDLADVDVTAAHVPYDAWAQRHIGLRESITERRYGGALVTARVAMTARDVQAREPDALWTRAAAALAAAVGTELVTDPGRPGWVLLAVTSVVGPAPAPHPTTGLVELATGTVVLRLREPGT